MAKGKGGEKITPQKIRVKRFAKNIFRGSNMTQAAIKAGVPEASAGTLGSNMMKLPEVQAELARLLEKENMGFKRVTAEIDRGLNKGKMGGHLDYLDRAMRLNDLGQPKPTGAEGGTPPSLILQILTGLNSRGVTLADGRQVSLEEFKKLSPPTEPAA